jgi:hypothetical protein
MSKRFGFYTTGLVALALLTFTASSGKSTSATSSGTVLIGAGNVLLGDEEVTSGGLTVRAFVPTGSLSRNCLATFSESPNFAVPGLTLFCGSRVFNGQKGLLIGIFPSQVIPTGLSLSLTIYQEGARGYGTPVLYTGE